MCRACRIRRLPQVSATSADRCAMATSAGTTSRKPVSRTIPARVGPRYRGTGWRGRASSRSGTAADTAGGSLSFGGSEVRGQERTRGAGRTTPMKRVTNRTARTLRHRRRRTPSVPDTDPTGAVRRAKARCEDGLVSTSRTHSFPPPPGRRGRGRSRGRVRASARSRAVVPPAGAAHPDRGHGVSAWRAAPMPMPRGTRAGTGRVSHDPLVTDRRARPGSRKAGRSRG